MALCPFATQKPVVNHGGPMQSYLGVVIHVTAGEGDPYNEFVDHPVSSHFGIGNGQGGMADGALEQYVDTSDQSWAQVAGNASYISVETEGEPTEALTAAQIATFAKLYAWLAETHGIPFEITDTPGDPGFITHGDGGVAWGNHIGCPGALRKAQRQAILDAAEPPPVVVPTTITEEDMRIVCDEAGVQLILSGGKLCPLPDGYDAGSCPLPVWMVDQAGLTALQAVYA